jgi:hypothetical protein
MYHKNAKTPMYDSSPGSKTTLVTVAMYVCVLHAGFCFGIITGSIGHSEFE